MATHLSESQPLDPPTRWYLLLLAAGLMGLLGVARWLEPDPRGYGTHMQLGLGPCSFSVLTGRPCPSCGMTTAFAWFARGDPLRAWRANPAGCLIVGLIPGVAAWLILCSWRGRPVGTASLGRALMGLLVGVVFASLMFWLLRILGASTYLGFAGLPTAGVPG
jgi:hypothetical protein